MFSLYLEAVPRLHLPYSCRLVATRGQYLGPLRVEANLLHTEEPRKNGGRTEEEPRKIGGRTEEEWKGEYGENMARDAREYEE